MYMSDYDDDGMEYVNAILDEDNETGRYLKIALMLILSMILLILLIPGMLGIDTSTIFSFAAGTHISQLETSPVMNVAEYTDEYGITTIGTAERNRVDNTMCYVQKFRNDSGENLSMVTATISYFNEAGELLGETGDSLLSWKADSTWEAKIQDWNLPYDSYVINYTWQEAE